MKTLAQQARSLVETTEQRSTESARSLYCELLQRHSEPRRDDAEALAEVCRVLNSSITEFERDAATVASINRGLAVLATKAEDEQTCRHASDELRVLRGELSALERELVAEIPATLTQIERRVAVEGKIRKVTARHGPARARIQRSYEFTSELRSLRAVTFRSLYCELLQRHSEPRRDDAEALAEVCRVLNSSITEFERDAATVASINRGLAVLATKAEDEQTCRHASDELRVLRGELSALERELVAEIPATLTQIERRVAVEGKIRKVTARHGPARARIQRSYEFTSELRSLRERFWYVDRLFPKEEI